MDLFNTQIEKIKPLGESFFLKNEKGFKYAIKEEEVSTLTGKNLVLFYYSKESSREIKLIFGTGKEVFSGIKHLSLTIRKYTVEDLQMNLRVNFSNAIRLYMYLQKNSLNHLEKFTINSPEDFDAKINDFFSFIHQILNNEGLPFVKVLAGELWLEGYFRHPKD